MKLNFYKNSLVVLFLFFSIIFFQLKSVADLNYEGFLLDLNGAPITVSTLVKLKILSAGTNNCTLFEKDYTVVPNAQGYFNIQFENSDGNRIDTLGLPLELIFNSRIDLNIQNCTPTAERVLDVSISDNSGSTWDHLGQTNLASVPTALNSTQVGGYDSAQLLKLADGVSTADTELSQNQWNEFLSLINGSSNLYLKPSDAISNLNGAQVPTISSGESIRWNSTLNSGNGGWEAFTPGSSTSVINVSSSNTDISVANSTTTPVLTLNSGSSANQIVKLDGTSRLPAVDGSLLTNVKATKIQSTLVSATSPSSVGQTLRFDGSNWAPAFISMTDLKSSITGSNSFQNTCGVNQTLSYNSVGDIMNCSNISIDGNQITSGFISISNGGTGATNATTARSNLGLGSAATLSIGTSNGQIPQIGTIGIVPNKWCSSDGSAFINCNQLAPISSQWTNNGANIYFNSGNIGVGTTTPTTTLDVNGQIKITGGTPGVGKVLTSDAVGLATWQTPPAPINAVTSSTSTLLGLNASGSGTGQVSVGYQAGNNYTGIYSLHIGYATGSGGGTGSYNTIVGGSAVNSPMNGSNNTVIGASTLSGISLSGTNNTLVGASATCSASTTKSVVVGAGAQATGTGGVAIGAGASAPASTVVIGSNNGSTFQERIRIDPSGYVGIGTTTPATNLQLRSTANSTNALEVSIDGSNVGSNNAVAALNLISSSSGGSALGFASVNGWQIRTYSDYYTTAPLQNNLQIGYTTNSSVNTSMSFLPNGNIGIGTTIPAYKLDLIGDLNLGSANVLRINGSSICTISGCTASSDINLKKNIKPIENSLAQIKKLLGVKYDWRDKDIFGDKEQIGLIAQDLEKVFPQVVYTDKDSGLKSVAYDHLVAPIIEAIKELDDENKKLKNENSIIKNYLCSKDPSAPICE